MYIMIPARKPPPEKTRIRGFDILAAGAVTLLIILAAFNAITNLEAAGASPGFGFLFQEAGFDVSESWIPYSPSDSYLKVIVSGVFNTIWLAAACILCATFIGVCFGLLSVGPSPIGRWLARGYVDLFRNLPKILILLVLYAVAVNGLPHVRQSLSLGPFHLSNRALNFPTLVWSADLALTLVAFFAGMLLLAVQGRIRAGLTARGVRLSSLLFWVAPLVLPGLAMLLFGLRIDVSLPQMQGFDYRGGGRVSLQFAIVAATLSIYHGAQIAEVVRGGLEAIPKGQKEAANALGLTGWQAIRLVILPQVFRIVIPPMNNQYVNLIKNTSIAIAVGYSDLMSVSGTIINQSFKPLEMMLITMAIYLGICLIVTTSLNHWHQRLTARESR
ncbi:ABC transporter permease subunit [uncultured Cohaesibacter sp.]|uniref:ABC transporter permease subunit n=1 Tax=uncultured Cohaesibacter sp. TaxID=1002546 RepID=UPI0029C7A5E5|nr:ABC transporter permease subunit [uncultured Cohaesibacter sp.]